MEKLNDEFFMSLFEESEEDRYDPMIACYCELFKKDENKELLAKESKEYKKMCELMDKLQYKLSLSPTFIGILIGILTFIFRTLLIEFAYLLKPSTFTEEMKLMKRVIFTVSFF